MEDATAMLRHRKGDAMAKKAVKKAVTKKVLTRKVMKKANDNDECTPILTKTITIGFIPIDWKQNEQGGDLVEIGNTDHSGTQEVVLAFDETGACKIDGKEITVNELTDPESGSISRLQAVMADHLGNNTDQFELAMCFRVLIHDSDEWEDSETIRYVTQDGPEIYAAPNYAGMLYFHLWDPDAETDRVIAVTPD